MFRGDFLHTSPPRFLAGLAAGGEIDCFCAGSGVGLPVPVKQNENVRPRRILAGFELLGIDGAMGRVSPLRRPSSGLGGVITHPRASSLVETEEFFSIVCVHVYVRVGGCGFRLFRRPNVIIIVVNSRS